MTSAVRTPLTAIAATPRPKESESKFTFNPVSGKVIFFLQNLYVAVISCFLPTPLFLCEVVMKVALALG